jgi:hypothetical protein
MKKVLDRLPGCAKWGSDTGPRCGSPGLGGGGGWPAPVTGPGAVQHVGQERAIGVPGALVALFTPARSRQTPPEAGPRPRETRGQAMVAGGYHLPSGPVVERLSTGPQRRTPATGSGGSQDSTVVTTPQQSVCAFRGWSRSSRQAIRRGDQVPHPSTRQ